MKSRDKQPGTVSMGVTSSGKELRERGGDSTSRKLPQLKRWQKQLFSALIAFHLLALVTAPLATPPASRTFENLLGGLQWYIEPMFMNHGYRFFGPDPGPSHLVEYEIDLPNGETKRGIFPNLDDQWPRLLYHRHFMLTERLQSFPESRRPIDTMFTTGAIGGSTAETALMELPGSAALESLARSYAKHLYDTYGAKRVRLTLVRHLIPEPEWIANGMTLRDDSLYRRWPLIEYSGEPAPTSNDLPLPGKSLLP